MSYIFEALADIKLTTENIQKVIKMYPRDNDWKKLITKHRRDIDALRRGKDLPKKVEDELMNWALDNGEIKSDDVDELDDFIYSIMNEGTANKNLKEGLPNQKQLEKDIMAFMKDGRSDGITGMMGVSKSLEQKYKVGPAVARSAVKKLLSDIVDGKYKG
tara:strand:+ start:102 stop:581 length:480 start_codon:yes stop_codon:yes gene_type:complete